MQQIPENMLRSNYIETLTYNRLLQINTDMLHIAADANEKCPQSLVLKLNC